MHLSANVFEIKDLSLQLEVEIEVLSSAFGIRETSASGSPFLIVHCHFNGAKAD
ncbi:hypothetical protein M6D81_04285 [Paenibacillus sp. J5C_2022]|nr:hypothetical protein [Paenibacillus sp. J5C2022]